MLLIHSLFHFIQVWHYQIGYFYAYLAIWFITLGLRANDPWFGPFERAILPFSLQRFFGSLELHATFKVDRGKSKVYWLKRQNLVCHIFDTIGYTSQGFCLVLKLGLNRWGFNKTMISQYCKVQIKCLVGLGKRQNKVFQDQISNLYREILAKWQSTQVCSPKRHQKQQLFVTWA